MVDGVDRVERAIGCVGVAGRDIVTSDCHLGDTSTCGEDGVKDPQVHNVRLLVVINFRSRAGRRDYSALQ